MPLSSRISSLEEIKSKIFHNNYSLYFIRNSLVDENSQDAYGFNKLGVINVYHISVFSFLLIK